MVGVEPSGISRVRLDGEGDVRGLRRIKRRGIKEKVIESSGVAEVGRARIFDGEGLIVQERVEGDCLLTNSKAVINDIGGGILIESDSVN